MIRLWLTRYRLRRSLFTAFDSFSALVNGRPFELVTRPGCAVVATATLDPMPVAEFMAKHPGSSVPADSIHITPTLEQLIMAPPGGPCPGDNVAMVREYFDRWRASKF